MYITIIGIVKARSVNMKSTTTQAPIIVWFDGTIIDIISHLSFYNVLQWLCWVVIGGCACNVVIDISVQYNGRFLPDIILLTQGYYLPSLGNPVKYHVVALYLLFIAYM